MGDKSPKDKVKDQKKKTNDKDKAQQKAQADRDAKNVSAAKGKK